MKGIAERAHVEVAVAYDPDTTNAHLNPVYENPDWAADYDVIIHDECSSNVKDLAIIDRILAPHRDGLPAVLLHCGMHSYRSEGYPASRHAVVRVHRPAIDRPRPAGADRHRLRDRRTARSPAASPIGPRSTKSCTTTAPASCSTRPPRWPAASKPRRNKAGQGEHQRLRRRLDQQLPRHQGLRHHARPQQPDRRRPALPRPRHPRPALVVRQAQHAFEDRSRASSQCHLAENGRAESQPSNRRGWMLLAALAMAVLARAGLLASDGQSATIRSPSRPRKSRRPSAPVPPPVFRRRVTAQRLHEHAPEPNYVGAETLRRVPRRSARHAISQSAHARSFAVVDPEQEPPDGTVRPPTIAAATAGLPCRRTACDMRSRSLSPDGGELAVTRQGRSNTSSGRDVSREHTWPKIDGFLDRVARSVGTHRSKPGACRPATTSRGIPRFAAMSTPTACIATSAGPSTRDERPLAAARSKSWPSAASAATVRDRFTFASERRANYNQPPASVICRSSIRGGCRENWPKPFANSATWKAYDQCACPRPPARGISARPGVERLCRQLQLPAGRRRHDRHRTRRANARQQMLSAVDDNDLHHLPRPAPRRCRPTTGASITVPTA